MHKRRGRPSWNQNQPKYLPTPEEIAQACELIQKSWSDHEAGKRRRGELLDCLPYGLEDWMLCPECHTISALADELHNPAPVCRDCEREEEARLAGRICRRYHPGNPLLDVIEIDYHGHGMAFRADNEPWWHGLE